MIHEMTLKPQAMKKILDGIKTVEGRLATKRFRAVQAGDMIIFNEFELICHVQKSTEYPCFTEMILAETPIALGFKQFDEALTRYNQIYWYCKDQIKPVMAYHISILGCFTDIFKRDYRSTSRVC